MSEIQKKKESQKIIIAKLNKNEYQSGKIGW